MKLLLVGLGFFALLLIVRLLRPVLIAALEGDAAPAASDGLGKKALDQAVDAIALSPVAGSQPDVGSCALLLTRGFVDAGVYVIDTTSGVRVRILLNASQGIVAQVWDHPRIGAWLEMVTYYHGGRVFTASTLPSTDVPQPPWITTVRVPGGSALQVLDRMLRERPPGILKAVTPVSAPRELEAGYVAAMAWTKNRGLAMAAG